MSINEAMREAASRVVYQSQRLAANKQERPTDDQIIDALSLHFRVHESKVIEWLMDMDLNAASDRMA